MPYPLLQEIRLLRIKAHRQRRLTAVALALTLTLLTALGLCFLDFWLRVRDVGLRYLLSFLFASAIAVIVLKVLRPALGFALSDVEVARWVERRYPELRDQLSSAVDFARQATDDPVAGSPLLRRHLVADITERLSKYDLRAAIQREKFHRVIGGLAVVTLLVIVTSTLAPRYSLLAASRLTMPWRSVDWPRRNDLQIESTAEVAVNGGDFEVWVRDLNGNLPSDGRIFYWFDGETESEISPREMPVIDGRLTHRLSNVTRPFRYRVIGGDDNSMIWHDVRVIDAPRLSDLRFTAVPPAYTGWPAESTRHPLRVLEGTRIGLRGVANRPLDTAELVFRADGQQSTFPGNIGSTGLVVHVRADSERPWIVTQTGEYSVALKDRVGLRNDDADRWEVRVVADRAPAITLVQPDDNVSATTSSKIKIEVSARDDLAMRRVELRYARSDQPDVSQQSIVLFSGPAEVAPQQASSLDRPQMDAMQLRYEWDLSTLPDLNAGTSISFGAVAEDYKRQSSASSSRQLWIVSTNELQDRLAGKRTALLALLKSTLVRQRQTRSYVTDLLGQLSNTDAWPRELGSQMQEVEFSQRQIARDIEGGPDSLQSKVRELTNWIKQNSVLVTRNSDNLTRVAEVLKDISQNEIPRIQPHLSRDNRWLVREERTDTDRSAAIQALDAARHHQDQIVAKLERLAGSLDSWDSYQRFAQHIAQLRDDQNRLRARIDSLRTDTVGLDSRSLNEGQLERLSTNARQQTNLADRLHSVQSDLRRTVDRIGNADRSIPKKLQAALSTLQDNDVRELMLRTARNVQRNQLGIAAQAQGEIQAALLEVLNALADQASSAAEQQQRDGVAALSDVGQRARQAEHRLQPQMLLRLRQAVEKIRAGQQRVTLQTERLEQAKTKNKRWSLIEQTRVQDAASQQRDMSNATSQLVEELAVSRAFQFAMATTHKCMDSAWQRLDRMDTGAQTSRHQRRALVRLQQLETALNSLPDEGNGNSHVGNDASAGCQPGNADQSNSNVQSKLAELRLLKMLQESINTRTLEIDQLRNASGSLTDEKNRELQSLTSEQGRLAEVLAELVRTVPEAANEVER